MAENIPLKINMFGEFSISYNGNVINDQSTRSKKLWMLLEYLVAFRGKEISQNDLIELLWPEEDNSNPSNTLKTLVHRVRNVLDELNYQDGKDMILYRRGSYAWNGELECLVDTDIFEKLNKKAASGNISDEKRLDLYLQALDIYKGDFLPKAARETWAVPISTYYHSQYITLSHKAIELLRVDERWEDIINLCKKAVEIDPYDELLHYDLILSFVYSDKQQAALKHYEYVTDLFYSKFGVTPSSDLMNLYKEIQKTNQAMEIDLNVIKEGLREKEVTAGAFFCEYGIFKEIYQLEARAVARSGQSMFICLMTISNNKGEVPTQKLLNSSMEKLQGTIQSTLRRGDAFTRYSVAQYLIMLPTTTFEKANMVLERITKKFRHDYPKVPILIAYKAQPLDPIMK